MKYRRGLTGCNRLRENPERLYWTRRRALRPLDLTGSRRRRGRVGRCHRALRVSREELRSRIGQNRPLDRWCILRRQIVAKRWARSCFDVWWEEAVLQGPW
jgi:hypothetical protein